MNITGDRERKPANKINRQAFGESVRSNLKGNHFVIPDVTIPSKIAHHLLE